MRTVLVAAWPFVSGNAELFSNMENKKEIGGAHFELPKYMLSPIKIPSLKTFPYSKKKLLGPVSRLYSTK